MAAQASDSPTASATSEELQLNPEEDAAPTPVARLPDKLSHVAQALEKVLDDPGQLPAAFANFCAAAYVKPEWAGAASEYLAVLFEDRQEVLAEMTRVPDLIIELSSGHYTLTFMVASRWAAKADLSRLTRLAEALIATQSKMNSPEVVDLMLALTTSLAVNRYSRAEHLLAAAETHATIEQQEALNEARLWLGAGRVVRGCGQEARDLWDHRLRRPRVEWPWNSAEECDALAQLSASLDPESEAAPLFQAVVPGSWWDMLVARTRERAELESTLAATRASLRPQVESPLEPSKTVVRQPIIIWRAVPCFVGGLVGAWALLLGIWMSPYDLVRPAPKAVTGDTGGMTSEVSSADGAPGPSTAEHPNAVWRREQTASLALESPGLKGFVERIELGDWSEHEALMKGQTPELFRDDAMYQKFLLWLHLDPPSDAEIRRQVPLLLADLRQDSSVIDLWDKLVYPGSLNAPDIRNAALRTQHDNKDAWSPTQRAMLSRIAAGTGED